MKILLKSLIILALFGFLGCEKQTGNQNPVLALRDAPELQMVFDEQSHKEAARAYNDWWNSFHPFKDKIKIDPLGKTNYRWH